MMKLMRHIIMKHFYLLLVNTDINRNDNVGFSLFSGVYEGKYKYTEMMRFFIRKGANHHALSDHIIKNIEYNERENMLKLF